MPTSESGRKAAVQLLFPSRMFSPSTLKEARDSGKTICGQLIASIGVEENHHDAQIVLLSHDLAELIAFAHSGQNRPRSVAHGADQNLINLATSSTV
jgi:hypothetical protein